MCPINARGFAKVGVFGYRPSGQGHAQRVDPIQDANTRQEFVKDGQGLLSLHALECDNFVQNKGRSEHTQETGATGQPGQPRLLGRGLGTQVKYFVGTETQIFEQILSFLTKSVVGANAVLIKQLYILALGGWESCQGCRIDEMIGIG